MYFGEEILHVTKWWSKREGDPHLRCSIKILINPIFVRDKDLISAEIMSEIVSMLDELK